MRIWLSIRYKMLLTILVVLLLAMGTYLYLATYLFSRDKLNYTYDLNKALVESLSEQTRSDLTVLVRELSLFVRELMRLGLSAEDRSDAADNLFAQEKDILRVEIYDPGGAHRSYANHKLLEEVGLSPADLDLVRKQRPMPIKTLARADDHVFLQNSSLAPDAAILTIAVAFQAEQERLVVAADFRHERLLRIFGRRTRPLETFLVDELGEVLAHPEADKVIGRVNLSQHGLVQKALKSKMEVAVHQFQEADGREFLGAYARVGIARLAVISQIPKSEALRANRELIQRSVLFAIAILIAAFVASVFLSRLVTAPVRKLREATADIGKGRFDINVDVRSRDEIGGLARSFEQMGAALKDTQGQLVRSEKMATFGQLGAGITHEVKNPMTGIIGFAQVALQRIDDKEKVRELLQMVESEARRCHDILQNFLTFARYESKKYEHTDLNQLVETSAKIIHHQLMVHKIKLEVTLGNDIPPVAANAGELQQVLLNLALNSQQAMSGGGTVRLSTTREDEDTISIRFSDDGPGIPAENLERIFEPFFTTKGKRQGTGLGLSVAFGIIQDHNGTITAESEPGKGTTFIIRLPVVTEDA